MCRFHKSIVVYASICSAAAYVGVLHIFISTSMMLHKLLLELCNPSLCNKKAGHLFARLHTCAFVVTILGAGWATEFLYRAGNACADLATGLKPENKEIFDAFITAECVVCMYFKASGLVGCLRNFVDQDRATTGWAGENDQVSELKF